jgi:hypothetical protein
MWIKDGVVEKRGEASTDTNSFLSFIKGLLFIETSHFPSIFIFMQYERSEKYFFELFS